MYKNIFSFIVKSEINELWTNSGCKIHEKEKIIKFKKTRKQLP